jgi:hypothetical protein
MTQHTHGPLRFREDIREDNYQIRAMSFDDYGHWRGRVIIEATPAGRKLRVFASPEVEVIQDEL